MRGTPLPLPAWWLKEVVIRTEGSSLAQLAKELSEIAHRSPHWRRETVGDFLRGEFPTWEMMLAFAALYDMPPAAFIAQSYAEADEMRSAARRHESPEISDRRQQLDKARQAMSDRLQRQTGLTSSKNGNGEGNRSRRRPRGVGSRRSKA